MGRIKTTTAAEVISKERSRAASRRSRLLAMERWHEIQAKKAKAESKETARRVARDAPNEAARAAFPAPPILSGAVVVPTPQQADIVVTSLGATTGSLWAQALLLADAAKALDDAPVQVDFPGGPRSFASAREALAWAEGVMFACTSTSPLVRYPANDRLTLLASQMVGLARTSERARAAGDSSVASETEKVLSGVRLSFAESLRGLRDALAVERKRPRARFVPNPPREKPQSAPGKLVVFAASDVAED